MVAKVIPLETEVADFKNALQVQAMRENVAGQKLKADSNHAKLMELLSRNSRMKNANGLAMRGYI